MAKTILKVKFPCGYTFEYNCNNMFGVDIISDGLPTCPLHHKSCKP